MHMERSKKPESINNSRQEKTNMKTDTLELSSSKSVKGLNKDVIANIIAFAKEDAKKGIYQTDEFINARKAYMQKNISPDRNALRAKAAQLIPVATNRYNSILDFFKCYGLPYNSRFEKYINIDLNGANYCASTKPGSGFVSVTGEHGEEILSWGHQSGWTQASSKEELDFFKTTNFIYAQAYDEARAEIKAGVS